MNIDVAITLGRELLDKHNLTHWKRKETKMKCECCNKRKATCKDFRDVGGECLSTFFVCERCLNLTDEDFFEIMNRRAK